MKFKKLLLITVCFLLLINVAGAYDYYEAGKQAYKGSEYKKASAYLSQALKENPDHLKCRYFYAQTLINLKQLTKAQKQYEKIIEISPLSQEARLAAVGIAKIEKYQLRKKGIEMMDNDPPPRKQKMEFKSGDNYIENAIDSGMITRWHTKKMPIKLYIEKPSGLENYKDSYFSDVKRAMDNWVRSVGNNLLINYELTNNPDDANIRVYFVDEILKKTGKGYITGLATPYIRGIMLDHYEIKFVPHDNLYSTALHELGHALGIRGHSSNKSDVMYSAVSNISELSQRDINTLAFLYKLDPDISNFRDGEVPASYSRKNEKILGSKDKLHEKKLQEAIEYTENYPNNVLSWLHLGKAYYNLGQYDNAVTSFKKAMDIDPTYIAAKENLAFTYKEMDKNKEAEKLLKELAAQEPANIAYSNNYAYFLMENKKYKESQQVLEKLIKANPKAKDDKNIKDLMNYLNQML